MPYHRVPRVSVHEDITAIEREGERIVSVSQDVDYFHVFTDYVGRPYETRDVKAAELTARLTGSSHATRLGLPGGDAA